MTEKIIRTAVVIVASIFFLFVMLFTPKTTVTSYTPTAPKLKAAVSVQPRKHEQVQYLQEEWTISEQPQTEQPENTVEQEEVQTYIGTYLDVDSSNDDLIFPEIDLQKIYSRIIYPAALKRKNIESSFLVRVFVNKEGNIDLAFPEGINSAFIKAIEKAFSGISAKPAYYKDKPTDVTFTIPFEFSLI